MDLYNQYMRQYVKLLEEKRFKRIMLVKYENIVTQTLDVLHELAKHFDLPFPEKPDLVENSASGGGQGQQKAMHKINERTYRGLLNHSELQSLCKGRDSE